MPSSKPEGWFLKYSDPRSAERMLVSMPAEMARDMRVLAGARGVSTAEFVRQVVTKEIAAEITSRPALSASFKGKLPMQAVALDAEGIKNEPRSTERGS